MQWVLNDAARLQKFNGALATTFPRKGMTVSCCDEMVEGLKEEEMIEVCRTARLIPKNTQEEPGRAPIWRDLHPAPSRPLDQRAREQCHPGADVG